MEQDDSHCYCSATMLDDSMLMCEKCHRYFHLECLQSNRPASLHGDTLFTLVCARCDISGQDICIRTNLSWLSVVMLTLYHLQANSAGKCGFFRWKTQICPFIDQNWVLFFGDRRKKTHTWQGTVAGTLSAGCPQYFTNGTSTLKESGWWRLTENRPPSRKYPIPKFSSGKRPRRRGQLQPLSDQSHMSGLRNRDKKSPLLAAVERRAKRDNTVGGPEVRQKKIATLSVDSMTQPHREDVCSRPHDIGSATVGSSSEETCAELVKQEQCDGDVKTEPAEPQEMLWSSVIPSSSMEPDLADNDIWTSYMTYSGIELTVNTSECLLDEIADDVDGGNLEIDPCAMSPLSELTDNLMISKQADSLLPQMDELMDMFGDDTAMAADYHSTTPQDDTKPTSTPAHSECTSDTDTRGDGDTDSDNDDGDDDGNVCTRTTMDVTVRRPWLKDRVPSAQQVAAPLKNCRPMLLYEEMQLLRRLAPLHCIRSDVARFRRKLLLRQTKRQCGLPIFNIDHRLRQLTQAANGDSNSDRKKLQGNRLSGSSLLDRYQLDHRWGSQDVRPKSFLHRLVGVDDDQLDSIVSPYTARVLKPFIWRDRESVPLKLKLLQEIKNYHHRRHKPTDCREMVESVHSIDYCYVRAEHIPAVNSLCTQFFWPGVDLSECLQYPDFSCVVLYRRLVVGFAFMVPDVTFNEAYISFIFTHPEWRRARIATFMLYHLIQTCMGKDVTLHVSASNPAMLLYQKFGFKAEQFIVGFYDKYFPAESTECRNAFFLRLQR